MPRGHPLTGHRVGTGGEGPASHTCCGEGPLGGLEETRLRDCRADTADFVRRDPQAWRGGLLQRVSHTEPRQWPWP